MIILDTDVLSAIMRPTPDEQVVAWLDRQPRTSVWITSVTVLEIQFGLQILPQSRRRSLLTKAFEVILADKIGRRVAPFDAASAEYSAGLMASRYKKGRPVELRDTMIAGIALATHASLATRNIPHFEDLPLPVINPWTTLS
jgi:predicted nucleic acid-binding protein